MHLTHVDVYFMWEYWVAKLRLNAYPAKLAGVLELYQTDPCHASSLVLQKWCGHVNGRLELLFGKVV